MLNENYFLVSEWCKKKKFLVEWVGGQQSSPTLIDGVIFLLFSSPTSPFFLCFVSLSHYLEKLLPFRFTEVFSIHWGQNLPILALSNIMPEPIKIGVEKNWTRFSSPASPLFLVQFKSLSDRRSIAWPLSFFHCGLAWWLLHQVSSTDLYISVGKTPEQWVIHWMYMISMEEGVFQISLDCLISFYLFLFF